MANSSITFGMEKTNKFKNDLLDVLKAVLFSTLISLGLILIFAIIIKFASLPNNVIMPVNIAIKIISLLVGILLGFKNLSNGLLKGAITGLVYMLFTFFIFAALAAFKDVKFSWIDLVTLPIVGAISGILTVNAKGHRQNRR